MTAILDGKGANFADVFEPSNRRIWVSLDDLPESVQKAFVAAEDRRFYQHPVNPCSRAGVARRDTLR
jgi:membrane peptidoglycan carboxypeptidase